MRSRRGFLSSWQACVCLMLVALLFYNPFAGLWNSSDGTSYDQLARNRATVGASELQHFSPVSNSIAQADLDLNVPDSGLTEMVSKRSAPTDSPDVTLPQPEFFSQLSNKPPPSL